MPMSRVLQVGDTFRDMRGDEYRVMEVLGEGNMAIVYLVHPPNLPLLRYAVKMVKLPDHAEPALREEFLRCFERERQIMEQVSQLHHPNIAALYGAGTSQDGVPYIILEQLEGETLHAHLGRHAPLPFAEALRIAAQIGEALTAIHGLDVVHRDLSTRNVFLCRPRAAGATDPPLLKLIDFGVAKFAGTTLHPGVYGSPAYMAPEQAAGGEFVDARADQFALAAIVFEMLAGEPAFAAPADPAQQVLKRVQQEDLGARLAGLPVPQPVRAALERALGKDPKQRYRSVEEFLCALQEPERAPSAGVLPADAAKGATPPGVAVAPLALPGLGSYALMTAAVLLCAAVTYKVSSRHLAASQLKTALPGRTGAASLLAAGSVAVPAPAPEAAGSEPTGPPSSGPAPPADLRAPAAPALAASTSPPGSSAAPLPAPTERASATPSAPDSAETERRPKMSRRAEHRSSGAARTQFRVEPHFTQQNVSAATMTAAESVAIQCLEQQRARRHLPAACRLKLTHSRSQSAYFVTDPDCVLSNNDFAISLELCIADGMRKKAVDPPPASLSIVIFTQTTEGRASQ